MTNSEFALSLEKAGYKKTKERLLVFSFLSKTKHPVSVKDILKNVGRNNVDQVTVYRILDTFKKLGVVNQIDLQSDCAFFELKDEKNDHHHIVCVECKKVADFKECGYKSLTDSSIRESSSFAKILSHSFELFGVCNVCEKK